MTAPTVAPRLPDERRRPVPLRYIDHCGRGGRRREMLADPNPMPRVHVLVPRRWWRRC